MALNFYKKLRESLDNISFIDYQEFIIHHEESEMEHSEDFISKYGKAKWAIVDILNKNYNQVLDKPFDLINWLHYKEEDELSYFLNEVGSNVLHHSQFKAPFKFHLWMGQKGFVVGVEQKGRGFNAEHVHLNKIKDNKGAAFDFFRKCEGEVFFDDSKNSKIVYFEHLFK